MSAIPALVLLALSATGQQAATPANDTVLVEFHSANCGSCRAMQPVVQRLASEGYPLQQIDVDQQPQYAEQFKIKSLPTFVLFSRGREAQRFEGPANHNELAGMFQMVGFRPAGSQAASLPAQPQSQQAMQYTSAPATAGSTVAGISPQQRAAWATVRLKIEDAGGYGFATGTIIDRHDDEALVMTCGHVFRQSQGKGKILVDLFAPGATQPVEGQLISYDLERDVALVSIRPGVKIEPVPVAPADYAVAPRDRVFTIGCDKGAAPSLRNSHIIAINRYQGSPNFTAEGAPVVGRSGGGLFAENGYLIGVCNAADAEDNEGLYAALPSVHWQLDQIGQSAIYGKTSPQATLVAHEEPAIVRPIANPVANEAPFASGNRGAAPPSLPPAMPMNSPAPNLLATSAAASTAASDDTEVIVIVRSRSNPSQQSEIFVMDRPPADIVRQLQAQARPAARGNSQDLLRSATHLGQAGGEFGRTDGSPIVRGQSQ